MTAELLPPKRYDVRRSRSGRWWLVDAIDGHIGPYLTRREAEQDRAGLLRFDREFGRGCRRKFFTVD